MPRVKFDKGYQKKFLTTVLRNTGCNFKQLGEKTGVHRRTINGWYLEHYFISENALRKFELVSGVKADASRLKILPDYWSVQKAGRKAGLIVAKKYGGPGTQEGRSKGGQQSQRLRRLYPERYQNCVLRKKIIQPNNSKVLSEFIGIILGDGAINSGHQIVITLHKTDHKEYVECVCALIKNLFGISPAVYHYKSEHSKNVVGITISSTALVEFLIKKGLKKGNKVKNQVDVPVWIKNSRVYSKQCLRGLVDTDGSVYSHRHKIQGHAYYNMGLTLTNKSIPLLRFAQKTLQENGFFAKLQMPKGVFLYRESDVIRYSKEIGFSNVYHAKRLENIIKEKGSYKE